VLLPRLASAIVFLPLFVLLVAYGPRWLFVAFVLAVGLIAQWELYRMLARGGLAVYPGPGLALGGLVLLGFGVERPWFLPLALSLAVAGLLAVGLAEAGNPGPGWGGAASTLLGVLYVGWLLGHALWLRDLPGGIGLVFLLVWVTWWGETAAYFVGRALGRRKLSPTISPGKTVEGAAAQLLVSAAVAPAGALWFAPALGPGHAAAVGAILGVVGQVGDLAESALKRTARAKDAGSLIPGHGGLLDRLDSLLFNVPALYYYAQFVVTG